MINFERTLEPESSVEQAKDILGWVEQVVGERTSEYADTVSISRNIDTVPEGVARHMPQPDALCQEVHHVLDASRKWSLARQEPQATGVLAIITFDRVEQLDENLLYRTHVNYHVIGDGHGYFELERHVTATEHGPHRLIVSREERWQTLHSQEGMGAKLEEMVDSLRKIRETRPLEKGAGMFAVTRTEAQQIIDFCRNL